MTRRATDAVRGVSALTVLLALAVGVPAALWAVAGWPLPHHVDWSAVSRSLRSGSIPDQVVTKAMALVCWVAWAWIVACIVVELIAWLRGRAAARVPLGGAVQELVGGLVASGLLVFSSFGALARPAAAQPFRRTPVTSVASQEREEAAAVAAEEAREAARPLPNPTQTPSGQAKTYVVHAQ